MTSIIYDFSKKVLKVKMENRKSILLELDVENNKYTFPTTISNALIDADNELCDLEKQLNETLETIQSLKPECDKFDYILSASSGALCGMIDIFLVVKP